MTGADLDARVAASRRRLIAEGAWDEAAVVSAQVRVQVAWTRLEAAKRLDARPRSTQRSKVRVVAAWRKAMLEFAAYLELVGLSGEAQAWRVEAASDMSTPQARAVGWARLGLLETFGVPGP